MRAIAREAGVDPALVRHYFSSKSELFVAAVGPVALLQEQLEAVFAGPADQLGHRLITLFLAIWDDPAMGTRLRVVVTTAVSHPDVAAVVRNFIFATVLRHVSMDTSRDEPDLRAGLVASALLGTAVTRHVLVLEPMAKQSSARLVSIQGPVLQRYLTGDIGSNRASD